MANRRKNGSGSVYQRRDGVWVAAVVCRDEFGKRIRRVGYGHTREEAETQIPRLFNPNIANIKRLELRSCDESRIRKYGISVSEYNAILEKQNFACACCKRTNPQTRNGQFVVDHCHDSGQIRGLLCHCCNVGIGLLGDSISGLLDGVEYLQLHYLESRKEVKQQA